MSYCFGYNRLEMETTLSKEEATQHLQSFIKKVANYLLNPDDETDLSEEATDELEILLEDGCTLEEEMEKASSHLYDAGFLTIEDNRIKMDGCTEEGSALGCLEDIALHFLPFMATNYCEGWSGYYDSKEGVGGDTYYLNKDGDFISSRKLAEVQLG